MFLAALVGWLDQRQQDAVAYLIEENRILRGHVRGRRRAVRPTRRLSALPLRGRPDRPRRERRETATRTDVDALNEYARDKLANYKRPKGISVWPELPKSAANKILRREVRDRLLADKK